MHTYVMSFYITIEIAWVEFAYHLRTIKTHKKHIYARATPVFLISFYTGPIFTMYIIFMCVCVFVCFVYTYLRHNATKTPITIPRAHSTYYPMSIKQMLSTGAWARALSLNTAYTHTHIIITIIITYNSIPP